MKKRTAKETAARKEWLLAQSEKLRQECNALTETKRHKARQHALQIIYGANATAPTGRR